MSEFFYDNISLRTDEARTCAEQIQSPIIAEIARAHAESLDMILSLMALPYSLLGAGISRAHRLAFFAQAMVSTNSVGKWEKSDEAKKKVSEEVERLFKQYECKGSSGSAVIDEAKSQLEGMSKIPELENSLQVLIFVGVSLCWATFESTCKDLWEAVLNARPNELAQKAFRQLSDSSEQSELTRKSVSVGLLARYDFDVQHKLGTILSGRFDFTSYGGIRTAYFCIFGESSELKEIFSDSTPQFLEAVRHLVVHRAGFIDEEYLRRTGEELVVGTRLQITGKRFAELADATAQAACKLLVYVDMFLSKVSKEGNESGAISV